MSFIDHARAIRIAAYVYMKRGATRKVLERLLKSYGSSIFRLFFHISRLTINCIPIRVYALMKLCFECTEFPVFAASLKEP